MPAKTHCKNRHLLSNAGTYVEPSGRSECYECRRNRSRRRDRRSDRDYSRRYRLADIEKYRARARERYAADPEKHRARKRDKYNPEQTRAKYQAVRATNIVRERRRYIVKEARRRARKVNQMGDWPLREPQFLGLLYEVYPYCYYCTDPLNGTYHVEHKTPLSRGGLHDFRNVRLSCASCNLRKGTRTAQEFNEMLNNGEHRR